MKRFFLFFALAALLAASCNKTQTLVPVTVHLSGFTIGQEDFPSTKTTTDPADYEAVGALTLAFYQGSTEVASLTQLKADESTFETFGEFSLSLPLGSYTLVALAYTTKESSPFVFTNPTAAAYTGEHVYETFACTQEVNITGTSAVEIGATLERVISMLRVASTDGKSAGVTQMRMTFSAGGKSFSPSTGLATSNTGFANTVSVSSAVGSTTLCSSALFLATDEQSMNVTIETLDADGNTVYSKTVNNVPFKRNRVTRLSGPLYAAPASSSFQLSTDWLDQQGISF